MSIYHPVSNEKLIIMNDFDQRMSTLMSQWGWQFPSTDGLDLVSVNG